MMLQFLLQFEEINKAIFYFLKRAELLQFCSSLCQRKAGRSFWNGVMGSDGHVWVCVHTLVFLIMVPHACTWEHRENRATWGFGLPFAFLRCEHAICTPLPAQKKQSTLLLPLPAVQQGLCTTRDWAPFGGCQEFSWRSCGIVWSASHAWLTRLRHKEEDWEEHAGMPSPNQASKKHIG